MTEVGRQPWIVQGYMRTSEAVTPAHGLWFSFGAVLLLYAGIGTIAILVLRGDVAALARGRAGARGHPLRAANGGPMRSMGLKRAYTSRLRPVGGWLGT